MTSGGRWDPAGAWDGPIFGEVGVLAEEPDGSRVQCHGCGGWYRLLGLHARRAHHLSPSEYKRIFGLRSRTALASSTLRDIKREKNTPFILPYQPLGYQAFASQTPEERS